MTRFLVPAGILTAILAILAYMSLYTVDEYEQALVLELGEFKRMVKEPGLHVKTPLIQNVVYLDKRILALDANPEEIIASDQKRLVVDSFIRWRIEDPLQFYKAVGGSEAQARSRLNTSLISRVRQVLGSVPFAQVLSEQRADLMLQIRDALREDAKEFGVEVVDVRIKRADLPQANSAAIYERMRTERQQEAAEARARGQEEAARIRAEAERERTIIIAEAEKQSQILRGEGDGDAVRIFADSFGQDVEFFEFYRSMNAYQKSLGKDDTTFVLSPDSEFFKYLQSMSGR